MRAFMRYFTMLALAGIVLAACGSLPNTGGTPEPTVDATRAAEQNMPHTWDAEPVLINIYTSGGMTDYEYAWSRMPELVVYADGIVIRTRYDYAGGKDTRSVEQAQIDRGELCALLRQIEAYGFFDFRQKDYEQLQKESQMDISDVGTTFIDVEAWRSTRLAAYALDFYLPYDRDLALARPLAETYGLLERYEPGNRRPYQPERVALLIKPRGGSVSAPLWPLPGISLKELTAQRAIGDYAEVVLEGQGAAEVYALFQDARLKEYTEGKTTYSIAMRPLLPHETWEQKEGWGRLPEFAHQPTSQLTCDGMAQPAALATTTATAEGSSAPREPRVTATAGRELSAESDESPLTPTPAAAEKEAPLEYLTSLGRRDEPGQ